MPEQTLAYIAFNRGLVSRLGLARADIKRVALSAEVMINWMPRVLGSMMLRPGLGYIASTRNNLPARQLPFTFSISDKAELELTDLALRVFVDDELITRPAVTTTVTNGNFDASLASWTDNDEAGATSAWVTGGYMGLTGDGTAYAIRDQTVAVTGANIGVEHALQVVVARGPVTFSVGSTTGGEEYIVKTSLAEGTHSMAFTPTGNFSIRFQANETRQILVNSCNVEAAGAMVLPTPWVTADLGLVRITQSADIIFVACKGYQQRQIERHGARSWSVVLYLSNDGPFLTENVTTTTLTAGAISGNTTLTASAPLFNASQVGAIFQITSVGQEVARSISAQNTFSSSIRITGVGTDRAFTVDISGLTGTGSTVTLQRSLVAPGTWTDVSSYTADTTTSVNDGLDNQVVYYQIGVKTGDYMAGTIMVEMQVGAGSITGVVRITAVTDSMNASVEVLSDLGGTTATDVWAEGAWSDYRGWPSAVEFIEGRLAWLGRDRFIASITDAYYSFDPDFEGDAGPINKTIGGKMVDSFSWILPLTRALLGGQGAEYTARSNNFDEPLTPSNCNIKRTSGQGSAPVAAVAVDERGMFVQRGGTRLFEMAIDPSSYNYVASDLTAIIPEIGQPSIVRVDVQRQPDTRIHCVRSDGTAAVLVYDRVENVNCWIEIETTGAIEDVMVIPGDAGENEDHVYYVVKRTINGAEVRYRERWATEDECRGLDGVSKLADAFASYSGPLTSVLTGLDHLEGEEVVVWGDGIDLGTETDADGERVQRYTVSGGQITLDAGITVTEAVVGLYYEAPWQSAKLVQAQNQLGLALNFEKMISGLGFVAADMHAQGIQYAPTLDGPWSDLPGTEGGEVIDPNKIWLAYDETRFSFEGEWNTDSRVCLRAAAPRPCTLLALTMGVEVS